LNRSPNPMNRERVAWLVASVMLAMLAFQLNGTLAHRDDDYAFVRTLIDVYKQVARNYVDPVDVEKLRQGAIDGMLGQLDPYSNYVPPAQQEAFDRHLDGTLKGIGVVLSQGDNGDITVISPIDDSPAFLSGVQAGDVILRVNGEEIKRLKIDDVQKRIFGGPLEVTLRVRHEGGVEQDYRMTRKEIVVPTVKGYRRKPNGSAEWDWYAKADPKIGYLRVTQFTPDTSDRVKATLEGLLADGMKGLVLDLRFNPGGRLEQAEKLVDLFVEEGVIVSTKGRNRPQSVTRAQKEGTLPNFPLAVLINEGSASASEVVAGALQDLKRATVVGERSFGKGSVQEVIALDDREGELKLTVAYYYLPSGRLVHKKPGATEWGVDPTVKVEMNADQEKELALAMQDAEVIGRPASRPVQTRPTTRPTTGPFLGPVTRPAGESVDPQLDAAVVTILGQLGVPATGPAAAPTTRAAR
jgi:carboxyl-terminal processing protease